MSVSLLSGTMCSSAAVHGLVTVTFLQLYFITAVCVSGRAIRFYWHFCTDDFQDKMSMELIWSFIRLEASLATVDFPNSPAVVLNI